MDPGLHFRVLLRFKLLVGAGFVLAVALAVLSMASIHLSNGRPHLDYRQQPVWQGFTTLLVAPQGFPWGSTNPSPTADPANYATLALVYAKLVTSDAVEQLVAGGRPLRGKITATYVSANPANPNGTPLPLIMIGATGSSPTAAAQLAERTANAFLRYLRIRADSSAIPMDKRVSVSVLDRTGSPLLLQGRSKTLPIVVFLIVLMATFALAFVLERARPRVHVVAPKAASTPARRTA